MSRITYRHSNPEFFIVGTVGRPGERAFYLQVSSEEGFNTVGVEKMQVQAMVVRLQEMLRELRRNKLIPSFSGYRETSHSQSLVTPFDTDFQVGIIGMSWNQELAQVDIEVQAIFNGESDEIFDEDDLAFVEDAPDLLIASLTLDQVRAFVNQAENVIGSGRPDCPFCGLPINPDGHLCPRANGYRR